MRKIFLYPFRKIKDFFNSRQFKQMILKFLNLGSRLPVVPRLIFRLTMGIVFMIGGLLWFLPVLGLWMLPLGILMIGMCIPYFYRRIRVWMRKLRNEIRAAERNEADSKPSS